MEQRQSQLQQAEQDIQEQLDRIYSLVKNGTAVSFLEIEYRRAVEKITQKYHILLSSVEEQKDALGNEEFSAQDSALRNQYKEDIALLAAAIDTAIEERGG